MKRRPRVISFLIAFLTVQLSLLSGILIGVDKIKEPILASMGLKGLGITVAITFILLLIFSSLQPASEDKSRQAEKIESSNNDSEDYVQKFSHSLKKRYHERYIQKLDGRFDITLEASEDWEGKNLQEFDIRYEKNSEINKAFEFINDAFEQKGRLLIVGNPGAGKTVLLLKLALKRFDDFSNAKNGAFPVIFNLASWSKDYANFKEWLIEMLASGENLPKDLAAELLRQKRLILFLDGLDELARNEVDVIAEGARAACLKSLNEYLQRGDKVVICCRTNQFVQMKKMTQQDAPVSPKIEIKDLNERQIKDALREASERKVDGRKVDEVAAGHLLDHLGNKTLLDALRTPFYFTTALEVFDRQILDDNDLPKEETQLEDYKKHLIEKFIERKLHITTNETNFAPLKTRQWLEWLACLMKGKEAVTFELTDLQPLDLSKRWSYSLYYFLFPFSVMLLMLGPLMSIVMFSASIMDHKYSLLIAVRIALLAAIFLGGGLGLLAGLIISAQSSLLFSTVLQLKKEGRQIDEAGHLGLIRRSMLGLIVGFFVGLMMIKSFGIFFGLLGGMIFGLTGGLISGWEENKKRKTNHPSHGIIRHWIRYMAYDHIKRGKIKTEDVIYFDFPKFKDWKHWKSYLAEGLLKSLVYAVILSIFLSAYGLWTIGSITNVGTAWGISFIICPVIGLVNGLYNASKNLKGVKQFAYIENPYKRFNHKLKRNLALMILTYAITLGLGLIGARSDDKVFYGAMFSAAIIFYFLVLNRIKTHALQHFNLRFVLYMENAMPLKYATFLDYSTEARILERDGGRWRFRHQNLQEYFADPTDNSPTPASFPAAAK